MTDELLRKIRVFIYTVIGPLEAVLLLYGISAEETIAVWVALIFSILTGLSAFVYRPNEANVAKIENAAIAAFVSGQLSDERDPIGGLDAPEPGIKPYEGD